MSSTTEKAENRGGDQGYVESCIRPTLLDSRKVPFRPQGQIRPDIDCLIVYPQRDTRALKNRSAYMSTVTPGRIIDNRTGSSKAPSTGYAVGIDLE